MNTVRNNIFAFSTDGILRVSRAEMHTSILFEKNIVVSNGSPMYAMSYNGFFNQTIASGRNLYFDYARETLMLDQEGIQNDFETFTKRENMDLDSIVSDPLFKDPKNGDFTLDPNSPAFSLGFVPIDLSDAGVRK